MRFVVLLVVAAMGCGSKNGERQNGEAAQAPARTIPGDLGEILAANLIPDRERVYAHAARLAAPEMRGRRTGTAEEKRAADYVAQEFRRYGVAPALEGGYLQEFAVVGVDGTPLTSHNVIGVIPGDDMATGGEHLVIGAHIDHLGVDTAGQIYAGADDNASGVAALLAMAESWSRGRLRPRRTVLLIGFGAEEQHMKGSKHYVAHPARPLKALVAMVNLDMLSRRRFYDYEKLTLPKSLVGISQGPGVGVLHGGAPALLELARCAARAADVPAYAPEDFPLLRERIEAQTRNRGDFAPFHARGIPYVFFSTSEHDDYHQPTDTLDKVDRDVLYALAGVAWRTAMAIDLVGRVDANTRAPACPVPAR